MRLLPLFLVAFLGGVVGLGLEDAAAQDCRGDARVDLTLRGPFEPEFRSRVEAELRASIEAQGFTFCLGEASGRPLAQVTLTRDSSETLQVTISVRDSVTNKRLARDVDLAEVPPDSRALALAVASDELLRASWIELSLDRHASGGTAAPEATEVPLPVQQVVRNTRSRLGLSLGVRFALAAFSQGEFQLGGEVFVTYWPVSQVGLEASANMRLGLSHLSDNGEVHSRVLGGSVGAMALPISLGPLSAGVGAWFEMAELTFVGVPNDTGIGTTDAAFASSLSGRFILRLRLDPLAVRLDLGAGAPIHSVVARDDRMNRNAYGGLLLSARLGMAAEF